MTSKLFTPITLRGTEVSNRIVVSPMFQYSATDGTVGEETVSSRKATRCLSRKTPYIRSRTSIPVRRAGITATIGHWKARSQTNPCHLTAF